MVAARIVRAAVGARRPAAGDGRGARRHPARADAARRVWPGAQHYFFPSFVLPLLSGAADIGLVFYMFLVGLELDPRHAEGADRARGRDLERERRRCRWASGSRSRCRSTAARRAGKSFAAFALFMGVAMSITAFPVLARILIDRRMLGAPTRRARALLRRRRRRDRLGPARARRPVVAVGGSRPARSRSLGLHLRFLRRRWRCSARPLLGRVSAAYDEAGRHARRAGSRRSSSACSSRPTCR